MKNKCVRQEFKMRFVDQAVQRNVNFDLANIDAYAEELEYYLESKATKHQPNYYANCSPYLLLDLF